VGWQVLAQNSDVYASVSAERREDAPIANFWHFKEARMDPVLLDVPCEIRTTRLVLRVPAAGDGQAVAHSVLASLGELKPWMPWATDAYDLAAAESWCRKSAGEFLLREQLQFLLALADGAGHVGNAGLFAFNWQTKKCEIGYWLATRHRGHGYMTEAVGALTRLAFDTLGMRRVQIDTDVRNVASRRVAERCGYALEGILRSIHLDTAGNPYDRCVYAILRHGV
jgi:RimJ/RimL family protein N-acetyltransferase